MTVIAVKHLKSKVQMSCDDQTTYGDEFKAPKEKAGRSINDAGKIFKQNGMLIGCAGAVSESNLLKLFSKNHKPKNADPEAVLEFLLEFREYIAKKTGNVTYKLYNHIFLVLDNKIFECMEMDVQERDDFWAVGSGMFLALAALHLGQSTKEAVEIAKTYDLYCSGETNTLTI